MSVDATMKILVVEDSKITRKMEIKALNSAGFDNIIEADDGNDAIEKLTNDQNVDLIISDWNMPDVSGYDLLVWVRSDEKCKDIPFIMATAQGEKKQAKLAEDAGVSTMITKPFGPPELKRVIEETFSGEKETGNEEGGNTWEPCLSASGKPVLRAAHIQITDHLTLGVMKKHLESGTFEAQSFELETHCMPGWNPVQKSLEAGEIDAAFILAPIAMDLFSYGIPIRLVLFAHKNGSICVTKRNGGGGIETIGNRLRGKSFFIPHILSIHHMLSNMFLRHVGLNPGLAGKEGVDTFFEVVPPVKMPEFLSANPDAGGFTVAEPLGTKAIASGEAELMFLSGEMWKYHPCCVVVFRDEFIDHYPDAVREFTSLLVESGQFIANKPEKAAEIAVGFLDPDKTLNLSVPVLKNVLLEPEGIKTDDLYPVKEDLDRIQHYMVDEMGIGSLIDMDAFVETGFADSAYENLNVARRPSALRSISDFMLKIADREGVGNTIKVNLDREGKYLFFRVGDENYGVNVLSVKEIVGMMPVKHIPQTPHYIKGVINLRGHVIPIVDLRLRFNLDEREYDRSTCVIVLENTVGGEKILVGIIVESVSDVINVKAGDIVDTPSFGVDIDTGFMMAMAKFDGGVRTLLNIENLFSDEEMNIIGALA